MRADVFQFYAEADAFEECTADDGAAFARKLRVQLTDSALVALEAGDHASHDKLTKRVQAVIAHRSTSNADVLVACVASDEQVTAPAQMRRHQPTLAVRCSSCCEAARCRRCVPAPHPFLTFRVSVCCDVTPARFAGLCFGC